MYYFYHPKFGVGFIEEVGSRITYVRFVKQKLPPKRFFTADIREKLLPVTPENFAPLAQTERENFGLVKRVGSQRLKFMHMSRATHCYNCKTALDSAIHPECDDCGWIMCPHDGKCGCSFIRHNFASS